MRLSALLACTLLACSSRASERVYTLDDLDVKRFTLGLPVIGDGTLRVSKSLVDPADWSTVRGHAIFACEGCTLGDDRTPLSELLWAPPDSIPFGHVTFDVVSARADFADGRVQVQAQVRSPELEIDARVDGKLAKQRDDIQLRGCVKYRPLPALLERDGQTYALFTVLGADQDEAGWYNVVLEGSLGKLRRLARRCEL